MKTYNTKIIIALIMLCGTLAVQAAIISPSQMLTKVTPAKTPPPLKLKDTDGKIWDIKDLKGKVVLINFWATWCPPCRKEMPSLGRLNEKLKSKGLVVLEVNSQESEDKVFAYISELEPVPTFTVLLDKQGEFMYRWKVKGLPSTFVLNKDGKIVYSALGGREFDSDNIVKILSNLLKQ